jgi:hypothetical protein
VIRTRSPDLRTLPSTIWATFNSSATCCTGSLRPLKTKDEVRAATRRSGILASTFSSSSAMPSAKYSLAGSPDMLVKGSTAMD